MANPEEAIVSLRLMKMADFGIPVLTPMNTQSLSGLETEEQWTRRAIARNIFEMVRPRCLLLHYYVR
jgi:acetyl-CoA carboxylase alpha subunit